MEREQAVDNFALGQLVKSKTGRDKGTYYFICGKSSDGARLLLADGRGRPIEKPKIKNCRHVQLVHYIATLLKDKLEQQKTVTNEEIRLCFKELPFLKENSQEENSQEGQCTDKEVGENV